MLKHLQSNVDSELERWVVRHCAGTLHSAYAEVRISSQGATQLSALRHSHSLLDVWLVECYGTLVRFWSWPAYLLCREYGLAIFLPEAAVPSGLLINAMGVS